MIKLNLDQRDIILRLISEESLQQALDRSTNKVSKITPQELFNDEIFSLVAEEKGDTNRLADFEMGESQIIEELIKFFSYFEKKLTEDYVRNALVDKISELNELAEEDEDEDSVDHEPTESSKDISQKISEPVLLTSEVLLSLNQEFIGVKKTTRSEDMEYINSLTVFLEKKYRLKKNIKHRNPDSDMTFLSEVESIIIKLKQVLQSSNYDNNLKTALNLAIEIGKKVYIRIITKKPQDSKTYKSLFNPPIDVSIDKDADILKKKPTKK